MRYFKHKSSNSVSFVTWCDECRNITVISMKFYFHVRITKYDFIIFVSLLATKTLLYFVLEMLRTYNFNCNIRNITMKLREYGIILNLPAFLPENTDDLSDFRRL